LARRMTNFVACFLRTGPLGGTAHTFTLAHQLPPCPSANTLAALIGSAPARAVNETQR
jgi:hypothetical protein